MLNTIGSTYQIFDWRVAPSGEFQIQSELILDSSKLYTTGEVTVLGAPQRDWIGGGTDSKWSNSSNWGGQTMTTLSQVRFGSETATESDNDMENVWVHGLTFDSAAPTMTVSGKKFGATGITNLSSHKQTISAPVEMFSDSQIIDTENGDIDIDAPLTGYQMSENGLHKTGARTLTLRGPFSYYGTLTVERGVLAIARGATALPTSVGDMDPMDDDEEVPIPVALAADATFRVVCGDVQVYEISGEGDVEVLDGSLSAESIIADTLTIGNSGTASVVPEPSTFGLLTFGAAGLLSLYLFRTRAWQSRMRQ